MNSSAKPISILVTGAKGFFGKNLVHNLKNIRDSKNRTHPNLSISDIFEYDVDTDPSLLDSFCSKADFVFHLAGINRPINPNDFIKGNRDFSELLLETLKSHNSSAPIMMSSSIQACLTGSYANSEYGRSKLAAEELLFKYSRDSGNKVFIYRLPNLFGKWCKPNYNSVVATFCHNIANDIPIIVNNRNTEIEFLYIDDLVEEMLLLLEGFEHRCDYDGMNRVDNVYGSFCFVPTTYKVTLGYIADRLVEFKQSFNLFKLPSIPDDSFDKKLLSTFISYFTIENSSYFYDKKEDYRGSFTELFKTVSSGQFSLNISKPGLTKGEHWHNSKWEIFVVVHGEALIEQRQIDSDEVAQYYVSGNKPQAVILIPGYTHRIVNLSKSDDLVTLIWANEVFDQNHPDTFFEKVDK